MRIRIRDIGEAVKDVVFEEPASALNRTLEHGPLCEYAFTGSVRVRLSHYRAGVNLFLSGEAGGVVQARCGRCLDDFSFPVDACFSYILVPEIVSKVELEADDLDIVAYSGEDIDISPLMSEQLLLSLPIRPLCSDDCKGLCPTCGANRNVEACGCVEDRGDPRFALFRTLKAGS